MMKFKSLTILAAGLLTLASCSSDDPAQNGEFTGTSYLNVSINLPTVDASGTRADDPDQRNDQFDDGEASEYQVNKAHLVIFEGENESDATVKSVYDLTNALKPWNTEGTTIDNVTTSAQTVSEINEAPGDNYWVLVVLNDAAAETHFAQGTSFAVLTTKASEMEFESANGIFMTNAPFYSAGSAQTLVKITRDAIKRTPAEAQAATSVRVFVERAVAKVQLTNKVSGEAGNVNGIPTVSGDAAATPKTYVAEIKKWAIDLTNKKSYIIRNVSEFDSWKGLKSKITGAQDGTRFYSIASNRIYWAIDPNYSEYKAADFYSLYDDVNKYSQFTKDPGEHVYCRENTFNVDNQRRNQTTRVIMKAEFKPQGATKAETFYTIGSSNTIYDKEGMRNFVIAKACELIAGKNDKTKYSVDGTETVSKTRGKHTLSEGDVKYNDIPLDETEIATLNNAIGDINTYLNGECFYVGRVQHFGEYYTPWIPGSDTYGSENKDDNYLGRYGVVRNNWYELQVSSIKTLGSPDVPVAPSTPDDENKYYISVRCNLHAWAKRVQDLKL